MIPPQLREQLVRRLTQKLVESPTFNSLVHTTQGTIDAFLDGIDEGRKQKEMTESGSTSNHANQAHQQQQQQRQQPEDYTQRPAQSGSCNYPRTHDFEKPRSQQASSGTNSSNATNNSSSSTTTSSSKAQDGGSDKNFTELEAFLRRTKASLDEAERRADTQRKNR